MHSLVLKILIAVYNAIFLEKHFNHLEAVRMGKTDKNMFLNCGDLV